MGPADKSFNLVKNILGKLDRSIDQVREQRLGHVAPVTPTAAAMQQQIGRAEAPVSARPSSPFGRATPLNPR